MALKQDKPLLSVFLLQEDNQLKQREQLYAEGVNLFKLIEN
jgi:hypothetical protein